MTLPITPPPAPKNKKYGKKELDTWADLVLSQIAAWFKLKYPEDELEQLDVAALQRGKHDMRLSVLACGKGGGGGPNLAHLGWPHGKAVELGAAIVRSARGKYRVTAEKDME